MEWKGIRNCTKYQITDLKIFGNFAVKAKFHEMKEELSRK